jgi:hypothetical protein
VLPGHGEPHRFASYEEAAASLDQCLEWMKRQPPGNTPILRFIAWITLRKTKRPLLAWIADNIALPAVARR